MNKIQIAHSKRKNSLVAGKELGKKLAGIDPENVFLFASAKHNFKQLIRGILAEVQTSISGCSTAGEIYNDKISEGGAVALGFNSQDIKFGSGIGFSKKPDYIKLGDDSISNALLDLRKKNLTKIFAKYYASVMADPTQMMLNMPAFAIITFIDGFIPTEKVLQGIKSKFKMPIPLIGGSAGDDLMLKKTVQICNNKVYSGNVVSTALFTSKKLGFGVEHGWIPRKKSVIVTKAKGRRVYSLDNKPAITVYSELLGLEKEKLLKEKHIAFKTGLQHPFAAVSMSGEYWLKHPLEVFEDGSIAFFSEVPEGVALVVADGTIDSLINAGIKAVKQAVSSLKKVDAMFIFNCVARKAFLGNRAKQEIKLISEMIDAPVIGLYTYGEQSFTQTTPVGHRNQTINILAIGE